MSNTLDNDLLNRLAKANLDSEIEKEFFLLKERVDLNSLDSLKNYIFKLLDELESIQDDIDTLDENFQNEIEEKNRLENLADEIGEERDNLADEVETLKQAENNLKQRVHDLEKEIEDLQNEKK